MVSMRRLALVAFLALACGSVTAQAQTLALAYKSGDTYKYTFHSTANENIDAGAISIPITLDMRAQETVTVSSVDSSGTADLSITLSNITMKSSTNGVTSTTTGMPSPTIHIKVAADGRAVSGTGDTFGGSPFMMLAGTGGGFTSAVLPDSAVKPGDTWSKSYDQATPMGSGAIHITTKSTYLRNEGSTAVVQTTSTATIDITTDMSKTLGGQVGPPIPAMPGAALQSLSIKGTLSTDVTTWLDPSAHRVVKSHMTGKTNATMTINMTSTTTIPGLTGPFTIKGTQTQDLTPA